MLQWLLHQVRDARIALDRVGYERVQRVAHREEADRQFDSTAIERLADEVMAPCLAEDRARFGEPIEALEQVARDLRTQISAEEHKLALLKRDFTKELASAYADLAELQKERQSDVEDHQEALADLRELKADIDWWYRKSDCYVFDRGRPIPQRRLIGADKNDLEVMKAKKLELQRGLDALSANIAKLDTKKSAAKQGIASMKVERAEAQRLRQKGVTPPGLRHVIQTVSMALDANTAEVARFKAESRAFLEDAKVRSGARALMDQANGLRTSKAVFLATFKTPEARRARAVIHRQQWLDAKAR